MKKIRLILMATMSVFMINSLSAQHYGKIYTNGPGFYKSIENKIDKGIRSGQLTRDEVRDLREELAGIDQMKHKAMRNGRISYREQKRIDHALFDFDVRLEKYLHNRKMNHLRNDRMDKRKRYSADRNNDRDYYYDVHRKKRKY